MARPPFRITPAILRLSGRIARLLGRVEAGASGVVQPRLRRKNRIRTVHDSLEIEGNTLSLDQVTAVFDGQRVLGKPHEVREVQNAIAAYAAAARWNPFRIPDLLAAHRTLMAGLIPNAGRWRAGSVGVLRGPKVTHLAPPAHRVEALVASLFQSLARDRQTPPLVLSCVLHYELEFIHPFADGNGRLGRLWQHVLLRRESPLFEAIPMESVVRSRQRAYYAALAASDRAGESTPFIEFALEALAQAVEEFAGQHRPARQTVAERLDLARSHFGRRRFTRRDYLALFPRVSAPTASRDLAQGVVERRLVRRGQKATASYAFS